MQTPLAAGLAWYIAHSLLGHHQPFFAPTAAAVSLSKNKVLRGQRAQQLIAGVVLGIGIGTVVKAVAGPDSGGSGAVVIAVAVLIALLAALALGGGFLQQGFAPRRWPERSRVRRADDQTAALPLVAATVLSLAHASTVAGQPLPLPCAKP